MPRDSLSRDEFQRRMDGFAEIERRIVKERLDKNYKSDRYEFLSEYEAVLLGALLDRLIPQESGSEKIDLVSFMDWAITRPLGYGNRDEGLPDEATLFRDGLAGIDQASEALYAGKRFTDLGDGDQDQVIRHIQEGNAEGIIWKSIPSSAFFQVLMQKAVAGYCAHPWTWMRIGFYGPAYPEGYIWVSQVESECRHEKKPGFLTY